MTMPTLALFSMPSGSEWLIILAIVLLIFGARKLPELARSFGSSINQFKRGLKDHESAETGASTKEPTDRA
jgi:sec-independent protein translocase protein TatA